jgi:cytochrome b561/polyisoprenoid-binding protein YceI
MTQERYSRTAIFLHWGIALALAFQLGLGWRLEHIAKGPAQFAAFQLHKSVGITILLLTLARVVIRYLHPRPPLPADATWAQWAAKLGHFGLYVVMLGAPITGWIIVSTAKMKFPTLLFGIIPWPHLPLGGGWREPAEGAHALLATLGLALFALHVVGALRHQFLKKDPILGRMVPFGFAKPVLALIGALLAMYVAHCAGWLVPFAGEKPAAVGAVHNHADHDGDDHDGDDHDVAPAAAIVPADEDAAKEKAEAEAKLKAQAVNKTEAAKKEEAVAAEAEKAKTSPQPVANWTKAPGGRLGFNATWGSFPVNGQFGNWSAKIRFSPDALAQSDIRVAINLGSVNTNDSQRDSSLKGAEFFNVGAHPEAVFSATNVKNLGGDRYSAAGTLNLHGVSRPVTLNFALKIKGDMAQVQGSTSIDRTAFGVGSGEYAATDQIGGRVGINFAFQAKR